MPDSEFALYKGFVDRTLSEVEKGLALDNYGAGSLKRRVHETLTAWKTSDGAERRCPAEKVVDGRFILGGDDASYLANGLAMLWSTVGCNDEKHNELGLAPAALYSPDAVNGIRRGLLAAFEKKNEKMRNDAGNQLANLMGALLPIVPFVCDTQDERESMHDFLETRVVEDADQRKKLFAFLMLAKRALDKNGPDGRDIPASSLAFQILAKAKEAHETAMAIAKREQERVVNDMSAQMQAQMEMCNESIEECEALLAEKEAEAARCKQARTQWKEKYNKAKDDHLRELQEATQAFEVKQLADDAARRVIKQTTNMEIERLENATKDDAVEIARLKKETGRKANVIARLQSAVDAQAERTAEVRLGAQKNVESAQEQLERERNRASRVRAELTQQVEAGNQALLEKGGQIVTLQEAVKALEAKVAEAEGDKGALLKAKEVMQKAESALRKCESAGKELEQRERAHRQTILGLTGRVLLLRLRRDKLTEQLNKMSQGKEQALADAKAKCEEEIKRVMLENMQATMAEAAKQGTEMQQIQENYEAQLAALQEQNAQDQSKQLQALREQHEVQLANLTSEFEQQRAEWTQSVGALQAELDTANAHSSALDAQLAQATQARQACEQRVADCAADTRAVEEAKRDLVAANEKVAACEAELDTERKKCDAKQTDLDALNDRMEKKWFELLNDLAYFKKQEEVLTTSLSATQKNLQAATEDNDEEDVDQLRDDIAMLTQQLAAATDAKSVVIEWLQDIVKVFTGTETESYDVFSTVQDGPPYAAPAFLTDAASNDDAWISTAVYRGLVGQRGPTEPADVAHCPQDALLPYALPDIDAAVKHLLPAQLLLRSTPDPTGEDVDRAVAALNACKRADGAKRQRVDELDSPAVTSEALALFQDDFAITGTTPAAELPAERCGVELPHEVRWMPQGPRGATMARVAVLEHAVARCGQLAAAPGVRPSVAAAMRRAATALKLQQLEPLYELHEAVECDDNPHPLGTGATRLVTRPCAIVRGILSFPSRPGVAPLPEGGGGSATPLTQDASLAQAMSKTTAATATLRNGLRRQGCASNVYVAPEAHELAFRSAPTGASSEDPDSVTPSAAPVTSGRASAALYRDETFMRIINRLIVATAALNLGGEEPDPVAAFLDVAQAPDDGAGAVTPQTRRQGLWAEMQRHVAVSQDRLWVFIRLVGGKIGGNASEVITLADEATLKAAKAIQEQRSEIARRVSDMQSKIVETVVSSMLKNSKMTMDYKEDQLAVIDAQAEKELKDLSTGASGRPFFEANVALKNLKDRNEVAPKLQEVLSGLADVGEQMQATLERTLSEPSAASASLVELSHPANSYFVMMRGDALAAVRAAHEKLNCELGMQGARRRLSAWELIEGGCTVLTERFADLCGYLLVQARTSTGVSAMYVSHQSIYTNASQARVALARLAAAAHTYLASVAPPDFHAENPQQARFRALTQGERVRDIDVTQRVVPHSRAPLYAPIPSTGWYQYGGFRKRT